PVIVTSPGVFGSKVAMYAPPPAYSTSSCPSSPAVSVTVSPPSTSSLPLASRSCTVMVAAPSVVMASGSAVMVDVSGLAAPTDTLMVAVESMAWPLTVPLIVTSPGVFGSKVAMYAPPPAYSTSSCSPSPVVSVTVSPPSTSSLPLASRSCTVMSAVSSVVMASGSAVMVDVSGLAAPTDTLMVAVESMAWPLTVPVIVTSPGVFGSKVAMYAPPPAYSTSSCPSSPAVSVTVSPPSTSSLRLASRTCTLQVRAPSVVLASGAAVMVDVSGLAAPTDTLMVAVESMAMPAGSPVLVEVSGLAPPPSSFLLAVRPMPWPMLLPYTTLFRSVFGSKVAMYAPPPAYSTSSCPSPPAVSVTVSPPSTSSL